MKYKSLSVIFGILLVILFPLSLCSCNSKKTTKKEEIILKIANWEEYIDEGK